MLTIGRSQIFPISTVNILQQFGRLSISTASNVFPSVPDSKLSIGFSCSSPNSSLLNVSSSSRLPVVEQRRFRKFFAEWTWNYKHKQSHKHVFKPYYKWDYEELKDKEYTHIPFRLGERGGRDPETGKKLNQRIGGGYKFDFFWVDLRRNRFSSKDGGCYEERILEVRRAPNHTAYVALAAGIHGRRWILATEHMKAGDVVRSYNYIPSKMLKDYEMPEGDSWPVGALPPGTIVCNIQEFPDANYNIFNDHSDYQKINAATFATILRQQGEFTVIQITKTIELAVKRECIAVIGRLSNTEHGELHWGSMNMKRRWGIKQGTGVWHKKDGYCGRKPHPLKKFTSDPDAQEPPKIKIPVTLGRKDYHALFGNATTMPRLEITSLLNTPEH